MVHYGSLEKIGLATSLDGERWKVTNHGLPVLDVGPPGAFDAIGVTHPFVLRLNGKFFMWYGGIDGRTAKDLGLKPGHVRIEQIGLAISEDGIHWVRSNGGNPVINIGTKESIDSIQSTGSHVIHNGHEFIMWYGAYNGAHTIGLATSQDGVYWTKQHNNQKVVGLQGKEQLGPSIYFDGTRYLMFYNTKWASGGGPKGLWTIFLATSTDGVNWEPKSNNQALLGPAPSGNFGSADGIVGNNHAVHPTKIVFTENKARVWYMAEGHLPGLKYPFPHQAIGLIEAELP